MFRIANILIVSASLFVGLLLTEVASRYIMPISPGAQFLNLDGRPVIGLRVGNYHYKPNTKYRQVSAEFDALTTIDRFGNRVPTPTGNPDIIFVGDSFAFGHGLKDEDTFAVIYCKSLEISCANLARPGLGTTKELNVLEYYLTTHGWRPKTVKLIMLAMSNSLSSGNDLYDNYLWAKNKALSNSRLNKSNPNAAKDIPVVVNPLREGLKRTKDNILQHSNLGRLLYFSLGHYFRSTFSPRASTEVLELGLKITSEQLNRFTKLSKTYSFKPEIFVIHPVQDLIRGTVGETMQVLAATAPGLVFIPSDKIFKDSPREFYYSYDGHFNAKGAKSFAEFLIKQSQ